MKIKNMLQYREHFSEKPSENIEIGTTNDPLLQKMQGEDATLQDFMSELADFAKDSTSQIFYEALQNAQDENKDNNNGKLIVAYNENYMLIANNGVMFNVDAKAPRDIDTFRAMLRFGKTSKSTNTGNIGSKGKGFKLIHTLMIDKNENDSTDKSILLENKYKKELKAPILISWSNSAQIASLKNISNAEQFNKVDYTDKEAILLAKLFEIYFPVCIGEKHIVNKTEQEIFSFSELKNCIDFINEYSYLYSKDIHKDLDISLWQRGSLFFIPLGKGVKNELDMDKKWQTIKGGMITSLPLLKNISSIQINEHIFYNKKEEISPVFTKNTYQIFSKNANLDINYIYNINVDIKYTEGETLAENKVIFSFIHNQKDAKQLIPANFYVSFPVPDDNYNLGFYLHFDKYKLDSSRQSIKNWDENFAHLDKTAVSLTQKLDRLKIENKNYFVLLFQNMVLNKFQCDNNANEQITNFVNKLKAYFLANIPTKYGGFQPIAKVKQLQTELTAEIELPKLGVMDFFWIDTELSDEVIGILAKDYELKTWTLVDICNNIADETLLNNWVQKLSNDNYQTFIQELNESQKTLKKLQSAKLIKSKNNTFYSLIDFAKEPNLFLWEEDVISFKEIAETHFDCDFSYLDFSDFNNFVSIYNAECNSEAFFNKIKTICEDQAQKLNSEACWGLVGFIEEATFGGKEQAKKLKIFKNCNNQFCALSSTLSSEFYSEKTLLPQYKLATTYLNDAKERAYQIQAANFYDEITKNWNWALFLENLNKPKFKDAIVEFYEMVDKFYQANINKKSIAGLNLSGFYNQDKNFVIADEILYVKKSAYELANKNIVDYNHLAQKVFKKQLINPLVYLFIANKNSCFYVAEQPLNNYFTDKIELTEVEANNLILWYGDSGENIFNYAYFEQKNDIFILNAKGNKHQVKVSNKQLIQFLSENTEHFIQLPVDLKCANLEPEYQENSKVLSKIIDKNKQNLSILSNLAQLVQDIFGNNFTEQKAYFDCFTRFDFYTQGYEQAKNNQFSEVFISLFADYCSSSSVTLDSKNTLKDKIFINGKNFIKDLQYRDECSFNDNKFTLSNLLPNYKNSSFVISQFIEEYKEYIPHIKQLLTTENKPAIDVYNELGLLKTQLNHIEQLSFIIQYDYKNNTNFGLKKLSTANIDNTECLDLFFKHKLTYYKDYYQIADFVHDHKIYSKEQAYLLDSEKLPDWVMQWADNQQDKIEFLYQLGIWKSNETVEVRKKIINKTYKSDEKFLEKWQFIYNTLQLFQEKDLDIKQLEFIKDRFFRFLYKVEKKEECLNKLSLPILHYTDAETAKIKMQNKYEAIFYFKGENRKSYFDAIREKAIPLLLDENRTVLEKDFSRDFNLKNIGFNRVEEIKIEQKADFTLLAEAKEWNEPFYENWKNARREAKKVVYEIKLLSKEIPYQHLLNATPLISNNEGDYYWENKTIFISELALEEKTMWDVLEDKENINRPLTSSDITDLFRQRDKDTIAISTQENERLQQQAKELATLKEENEQLKAELVTKEKTGSGNVQIQEELKANFENNKSLVEKLLPKTELLEKLGKLDKETLENLLQLLADYNIDLESNETEYSEDDNKVEIGNWGERYVKLLLEKEQKEGKITSFVYLNEIKDEKKPYDFIVTQNNGRKIYVDAKGTVRGRDAKILITKTELPFIIQQKGNYEVYRVYDIKLSTPPDIKTKKYYRTLPYRVLISKFEKDLQTKYPKGIKEYFPEIPTDETE